MCGIAGILSFEGREPVRPQELERMAAMLAHRGPDGSGTYLDSRSGRCGLAHRRLSIIDLKGGKQPMSHAGERFWISYNGECYNYRELRQALEQNGHRFNTQSDTEVILHLYEVYGADCVEHMRGMFAFAIWDELEQTLFLARDRLGQKPLFYGVNSGQFYFASECKAIVAVDGFPRRPNLSAVSHYLLLQYVPAPASGFDGIEQLAPAHRMTVSVGSASAPMSERYWSVPTESSFSGDVDEAAERLRSELVEATRMRMISDVPLGAFLSGGIDSTLVVGLMSQIDTEPVKACTIGFDEEQYNELPFARQAAERFNTDLDIQVVRANDCLDAIDHLSYYYDEPFADPSAAPTYFVSRLARSRVTVALTGDAGDELFGGYHRYARLRLSETLHRVALLPRLARLGLWQGPASWKRRGKLRGLIRFLRTIGMPVNRRYLAMMSYFDPDHLEWLCSESHRTQLDSSMPHWDYLSDYFPPLSGGRHPIDDRVGQAMVVDANTYLPGALNTKADRASMSVSLELRCPFQDHKVVELAFSLPVSWRLNRSISKYILRKACADLLPPAIACRSKKGFGLPLESWFQNELRDMFMDTVLSPHAMARGYFRRQAVEQLVRENDLNQEPHGDRLWALLMLELWHQRFIDRKPHTPEVNANAT